MGYSGLESYTGSDLASDLAATAVSALATVLAVGLKEEANEYNTPGCVNVALFFETYICPLPADTFFDNAFVDIAHKAEVQLRELVKRTEKVGSWGDHDEGERIEHHEAYKRMLASLKKFVDEHDY